MKKLVISVVLVLCNTLVYAYDDVRYVVNDVISVELAGDVRDITLMPLYAQPISANGNYQLRINNTLDKPVGAELLNISVYGKGEGGYRIGVELGHDPLKDYCHFTVLDGSWLNAPIIERPVMCNGDLKIHGPVGRLSYYHIYVTK